VSPASALATTSLVGQVADHYRKAPPAPGTAPLYHWTGFYVGANIGGAWLNTTVTDAFAATIETVVTG
jgi:outer membrane immunogenic protein